MIKLLSTIENPQHYDKNKQNCKMWIQIHDFPLKNGVTTAADSPPDGPRKDGGGGGGGI